MLAARHSCSASIARTSRCGQVIGPSESTVSARGENGGTVPVRPADQKRHDRRSVVTEGGQPRRKFLAGERLSPAIERDDIGVRRKALQQCRGLLRSRPALPSPPARTSRNSSGHGKRLR